MANWHRVIIDWFFRDDEARLVDLNANLTWLQPHLKNAERRQQLFTQLEKLPEQSDIRPRLKAELDEIKRKTQPLPTTHPTWTSDPDQIRREIKRVEQRIAARSSRQLTPTAG